MRILAERRSQPVIKPRSRVAPSLKAILKPLDDRFGPGVGTLEAYWAEIVGETLSAKTRPLKLSKRVRDSGGILDLAASGPVAALIQHQIPTIIARANRFLGDGAVAKVRIIQTATTASQGVKVRKGPADAAVESHLAQQFEDVTDPALKAALIRLERARTRKP